MGELPLGTTATDLVLTVTQMLRKKGVVDKFVEFYGPGPAARSDSPTGPRSPTWRRSTAPPWGSSRWTTRRCATWSGRGAVARSVERVERYGKEQGLFRTDATPDPEFTATLELDLGTVTPSLAGPKRPQDLVGADAAQAELHRQPARPDERQRSHGAQGAGAERLLAVDGRGRGQRRPSASTARRRLPRPSRPPTPTRRRSFAGSSTARTSRCTTGPW